MLSFRPVSLRDNTKTPGHIRSAYQAENALYTGNHKKVASGQTPFQSSFPLKDAGDSTSPLKAALSPVKQKFSTMKTQPLQDKTPFPNRTTHNGGGTGKALQSTPLPSIFNKFRVKVQPEVFSFNLNTPALHSSQQELSDDDGDRDRRLSTPLPSSARRHSRAPRSANKSFETPVTSGRHWDVSDISIELDFGEKIEEETDSLDSGDDEIEYMPPKVEVPYQPPFDFDIPDYKEVGAQLFNLRFTGVRCISDDTVDVLEGIHPNPIQESWDDVFLSSSKVDDDDPDDPFVQARKMRAHSKSPAIFKPTSSRPPSSAPSSRPGTATSRIASKRPATSTSNRVGSSTLTTKLASGSVNSTAKRPVPSSSSTTARVGGTRPATAMGTANTSRIPTTSTATSSRVRSSTITSTIPPRSASTSRIGGGNATTTTTGVGMHKRQMSTTIRTGTTTSRTAPSTSRPVSRTASSTLGSKPPATAATGGISRSRSMTIPTSRSAATTKSSSRAGQNPGVSPSSSKDDMDPESLGLPDLGSTAEVDEFMFDL